MAEPCASKSLKDLVVTTFKNWSSDNASQLAAALAYYAIFSIGPLLLIAVAICGVVFGQKAASDQLRPNLAKFLGDQPAAFLQSMVSKAASPVGLSVAGVISLVLVLYAATNVFVAMQSSLNTVFDVVPKPGRTWKAILKDRAMTFLMVMGVGVFMLLSIVLNTALAAFTKWGSEHLWHSHPLLAGLGIEVISFLLSAVIFTGVFAMLFKYLPDIKISWRETLGGAAVTSVLFTLARIGLGYYLSRSSVAGPFGAAGSLVVLLLFVYYSSQILFLGAEFTQVWACRNGEPVVPSDNAVRAQKKAPRLKNKPEAESGNNRPFSHAREWWSARRGRGDRSWFRWGREPESPGRRTRS